MNTPATPLQDLALQVEQLREMLLRSGNLAWAEQLDADLAKLRAGDRMGCASFLSHFGGMGSLNDLQVGDSTTDACFQAQSSSARALAKLNYPSFVQQLGRPTRGIFIGGLTVSIAIFALALML
ncbi:hypothetical protein [Pseudorhodoferax sp. Leaf274]|uniref:DUF6966 domain-containing protein n=1 Tax=Pseudorhodoferax sp. Leaf274 TaxID=1736318 RepID=UPI00138EF839|nr:hypothetical protein [Pseudorhodoferax sp. Leaf274]